MLRPEFAHLKYKDLPWNGAKDAPFTWRLYRGEITPVVGFDHQYRLRLKDGSCVWVDKDQTESIFVR
jgi:hypothetical protein